MYLERIVGKRVIVTGASSGIGRQTALAFARANAHVIATGRRADALDELKTEAAPLDGSIETVTGDITDSEFLTVLVQKAEPVDILVNCAGMLGHGPFLETDSSGWLKVWEVNVHALMCLSQAVALGMRERKSGHIINVTSILASKVYRFTLPYAATKHAVRAISKGMRMELAEYGIKVTELAPGLTDTPILRSFDNDDAADDYDARPYPPLDPDEVAAAIVAVAMSGPNTCPERVEVHPLGQIE
jgi:NADP-dependent 3-hydroxy acid dehydrogenase YdfG